MLPHQPVDVVLLPNSTGVPPITPFDIFVIVIYPSNVIPTVVCVFGSSILLDGRMGFSY
ncbi:hypothetical protein PtA15_7A458 [Puccinia triticina]|uniref:Uncharacterized protein n=1 Tax=Puccinia triticina TaxID=208348 RepID=A0ABY7CPX9_9BASI|nr:uncharacterized protein PtA15_7A458 [Puccinia triticina]WAQ86730.1 hypothetical protein PtA15_7A458 [Puccinia triticina]